jgi:hypothetical protein
MMAIKVMKQGESWIGEIRCATVPRVGEIVYMGDQKGYEVIRVVYEWGHDENSHPFIILNPTPWH